MRGIKRCQTARSERKSPRGKAIKEDLGENFKNETRGLRLCAVKHATYKLLFVSPVKSAGKSAWLPLLMGEWLLQGGARFVIQVAQTQREHRLRQRLGGCYCLDHIHELEPSSRLVGMGDWWLQGEERMGRHRIQSHLTARHGLGKLTTGLY